MASRTGGPGHSPKISEDRDSSVLKLRQQQLLNESRNGRCGFLGMHTAEQFFDDVSADESEYTKLRIPKKNRFSKDSSATSALEMAALKMADDSCDDGASASSSSFSAKRSRPSSSGCSPPQQQRVENTRSQTKKKKEERQNEITNCEIGGSSEDVDEAKLPVGRIASLRVVVTGT